MNQLDPKSSIEYTLKVLTGPEKGAKYKLLSTNVHIGRSSDNDIPLVKDPKCSRKHAVIQISTQSISIKSLNEKNLVTVDSQTGMELPLKNGSKIKLGSSVLVFNINMLYPDNNIPTPQKGTHLSPLSEQTYTANNQLPPITMGNGKGKFYLILFILAAIVLFLLNGPIKQKSEIELISNEEIDNKIEATQKVFEAEQKAFEQKGKNSPQYTEGQSYYVRGFRDFKKGQYERAVESFEACLSIFPTHILCTRYKKLAEKKFQELIQYHMVLGKRQLDQGQYQACQASFRNVMYMVKSPQSRVYKEARANFILCKGRLKDRF